MRGEYTTGALYRGDRLADRLHLRLFTAERREITPEWRTRDVLSTYWRFYANDAAGASLLLEGDGEPFPLEPGRLYFVPAGVRFSCRCDAPRVGHLYVHFDVLGLPEPALHELFGSPVLLPPSPELEAGAGALGGALSAPRAPRDDLTLHCRIKALLYAALARCLEAVPEERRERCLLRAARMEPLRPALECVEADLAGDLSNARLAALCCLSEDHFARRFRECVGTPPGEWVARRRVEAAAQRLLFTDEPVEAVAEACGFANRFYFSRVFARRTGAAPAAYRRAGRVR